MKSTVNNKRGIFHMDKFDSKKLELAIQFTETYKKFENEHIAIREAMCLKSLYPAILSEIKDYDLFAGGSELSFVGFRYSFRDGDTGYFCDKFMIAEELEKEEVTEDIKKICKEIICFWEDKTTLGIMGAIDKSEQPIEINNALLFPNDGKNWQEENIFANYMPRMAEINLNFDKLLKHGISGMKEIIGSYLEKAKKAKKDIKIYEAMIIALDSFSDICKFYAENARILAITATDERKQDLLEMSEILNKIATNKPETFREAIQLLWLYTIISVIDNFGRMDVYLGDFYARDIDYGRITEEQALRLMQTLFQQINDTFIGCGRIVLGGRGRANEENADRFALLAMKTVQNYHWKSELSSPQVSLRIYQGMNQALFEKALDTVSKGSTYPFLYNDDKNITEIAAAYGVSIEEAQQYVMSNCGEFSIEHRSFGSPNGSIIYPKLFEVTLYNGYDPGTGMNMGLKTGEFTAFKTFEEFFEAYLQHVSFFVTLLTDKARKVYQLSDKNSCNLYSAMLFDGCLEKGRGLISGAQYLGLDMETHGLVSVADSLTAIKELVFDKNLITGETMLKALRANFKGYEKEKRLMLEAPKFGNDHAAADEMAQALFTRVHTIIGEQAKRVGLDFCVASNISVDAYYHLGKKLGATPDGRSAGKPFTNGYNPLSGNDKNGITALLNSMTKMKPGNSGGQSNHIKLGSDMFTIHRKHTEALLGTYFENGGVYLCIEALNREALENAVQEPEKYQDLMVRIGGFSARFVTLPREFQLDILSRTQY